MAKSSGKNLFSLTTFCFLVSLITFIIFMAIRSTGEDTLILLLVLSAGTGLIAFIASIAALRSRAKQRGILILMLILSAVILVFYGMMFAYKTLVEHGLNEMMNAQ